MKSPYVSELQPNQVVTTTFLVQGKDVRQKKSGEPYLSLMLGDRTGEIDAKMWDNVEELMETFERNDFVRIRGIVQLYQNKPQITIHKLVKVAEEEVDFADYFPASARSPEEMYAELLKIVEGIGNPHLKALLTAIFDDTDIAYGYARAPAAKSIHHAYVGGLIEHVLSLCQLCRLAAGHYKNIDLDLLLAGALLHDIGKIRELTYDRSFGYSDEGHLIGHIVIGLRIIDEKIGRLPDFPANLRTLVDHLVLSHHGELQFGSPKVPLFPEALLLHHLDNLDSKMDAMRSQQNKDRLMEGNWTGNNFALDRLILKKEKFLEEPVPAPPGPAEPSKPDPVNRRKDASPKTASLFGERLRDALNGE